MTRLTTNTLMLQTPEGIQFSLPLASPVSRFLSWLIDCACIVAASAAIQKLSGMIGAMNEGVGQAVLVLSYFAISIGYGIVCEWYWRGQTVGKRTMRLRVMDAEGMHLQFSQVVVRNLLRFVDALPVFYMVGGAVCLLTAKAQRLGDLAANTIVIRQPKLVQPDVTPWLGGKYNSLLEHRHLAARLRQHVSPELAAVGLSALMRREELLPEARIELFANLAREFRSLVEFPEDAVEQLSDEQYVRNVVEVVYGGAAIRDQGPAPYVRR